MELKHNSEKTFDQRITGSALHMQYKELADKINTEESKSLFLCTASGKTIVINCVLNKLTLDELRTVIYYRTGANPSLQRIIYHGKQLSDESKTLSECGIESDQNIHLVIRCRGFDIPESFGHFGNYKSFNEQHFDAQSYNQDQQHQNVITV